MDADRKEVTWENLYKHIYKEEDWSFWGLFDFENRDKGCITLKAEDNIEWTDVNEKYREFVRKYGHCKDYKGFKISGDADFGDLKNNKNGCNSFISDAEARMHKFPNFSLMPCTGAMNDKKRNYGDRFHVFIYVFSGYYEKKIKVRTTRICKKIFISSGW